jgi:hypothetical protein
MEEDKRKIIVKEIEHWRKSRLLPEQYCDFLLNLYLEDGQEKTKSRMGVSAASVANSNWKIWVLSMAIVGIISFSALNFNSFGIPLQIGVSALFVMVCYVFGFQKRKDAPVLSYLLNGVASIFLLFIGLYIMNLHGIDSSFAYVGYLAISSTIWLLSGLLERMTVLQFCGLVGLLGAYGWLLVQKLQNPMWWPLQLSWLPVSVFFIWLAWLVHHKRKDAAGVSFVVGCLTWYAPEGISFLTDVDATSQVIQLSFMIKLLAAGIGLFALRKKWVEWVI